MTNHIALAIVLSTSGLLTACADSADSVNLDGLDAYDQDTGGGKGDDPNCSDASYREFIQPYMRGEATADANPCTWGNDGSYRIWAYVVGQQLKPTLDRYGAAITQRFNNAINRDQVAAAGTVDAATRKTLMSLLAIKPAHAGKVGFGAWNEYAFAPAFQLAMRPVDSKVLTPDSIDQLPRQVMSFEDEWLGYVERARPEMTEALGFTIWWQTVESSFRDSHGTSSTGTQAPIDQTFRERLTATHPDSTFDADGEAFQTAIVAAAAADYTSPEPRVTTWNEAIKMKPRGGGPASYKAWAVSFVTIAPDFNARTHSAAQADIFSSIIAARPCASGPDVDAIVQRVTTALAAAGNDPSGTPLAQDAAPVACPSPSGALDAHSRT